MLTSYKFQIISSNKSLILIEPDSDVLAISHAIQDIIEKFLIQERIEFDYYIFKNANDSGRSKEILTNLITQSGDYNKVKLSSLSTILDQIFYRSTVMLLPSMDYFKLIHEYSRVVRYQNQHIKLIIYIEKITAEDIEQQISESMLTIASDFISLYTYFVFSFPKSIHLLTTEWFTEQFCNAPQIVVLNSFSKESMTWQSKLVNYNKFMNFYGCELVLMLPVLLSKYDRHIWGYVILDNSRMTFKTDGVIPAIFEIASNKFNFKVAYQPVRRNYNSSYIQNYRHEQIDLIMINNSYKHPNVWFEIFSIDILSDLNEFRTTQTFMQSTEVILVTPAEAYTAYEKLLLPFDKDTWIILLTMFSIAFFIIFLINHLSRVVQDVFYGNKIKTPTTNLIRVFFGIAQTRMPEGNFSRQILILFLYFCLIIRTCFQSKMFEFITSNPRRPPPKSIQDLVHRNYTLYTISYIGNLIQDETRNW